MTEQGHLPSASAEIEPCTSAAVDLQHPWGGSWQIDGANVKTFRMEWGILCSKESGGAGL